MTDRWKARWLLLGLTAAVTLPARRLGADATGAAVVSSDSIPAAPAA